MQCDCYTMCPPLCKRMVVKVTRGVICLRAAVQVLRTQGADALPGSPSFWCWHLTRLKCMSHLIATGSLWIMPRQQLIVRWHMKDLLRFKWSEQEWACLFEVNIPGSFFCWNVAQRTSLIMNKLVLLIIGSHQTCQLLESRDTVHPPPSHFALQRQYKAGYVLRLKTYKRSGCTKQARQR